jgi:hypothetical protein
MLIIGEKLFLPIYIIFQEFRNSLFSERFSIYLIFRGFLLIFFSYFVINKDRVELSKFWQIYLLYLIINKKILEKNIHL